MRLSRLASRRGFSGLLSLILSFLMLPQSFPINRNQYQTLAPASSTPVLSWNAQIEGLEKEGILITGEVSAEGANIISVGALRFVASLQREVVAGRREALLNEREDKQRRYDSGQLPNFLPETRFIREGKWKANEGVLPIPADLQDRRIELTGPADKPGMVINALNSRDKGVTTYMTDFEDSMSPMWPNPLIGQEIIKKAINGTLEEKGKKLNPKNKQATLIVRPRGWHLVEKHVLVDRIPVSGGLFDFALYLYNNAETLKKNGTGPYFYLPKMESYKEAQLWDDIFTSAEKKLGLKHGTIKATVLIETLPAAFEMDEIIFALKDHMAGLNCGRWDYIFNSIKRVMKNTAEKSGNPLPDRALITMSTHFMQSYVRLLIQTCHKRGVHAMGGMSAFIPVKSAISYGDIPKVKGGEPKLPKEICDKLLAAGYLDKKGNVTAKFNAQAPALEVDWGTLQVDAAKVISVLQDSVHRRKVNDAAIDKVYQDKMREVLAGHDGTWIAHPDLAEPALRAFNEKMPQPNQIDKPIEEVTITQADLVQLPVGEITEEGVRENITSFLRYMEKWLSGTGAVGIDYYSMDNNLKAILMEDAATAEISRALLWHWLHHPKAVLKDGRKIDKKLVYALIDDELNRIKARIGDEAYKAGYYGLAKDFLKKFLDNDQFQEFLTLMGYESLDNLEELKARADNGKPVADPIKAAALKKEWATDPRWQGIERTYTAEDVVILRGKTKEEHSIARDQAIKLWKMLKEMQRTGQHIRVLSAYNGVAAEQEARAGLKAIYYSGWQEAAVNWRKPDQSIYPYNSVPISVRKLNDHLVELEKNSAVKGENGVDWMLPIVADAEAGFGGTLNVEMLTSWLVRAGAAGIHFEDQLGSEKKCGHMGGKVLVPTSQFCGTLSTARLTADYMEVPTVQIARTDAEDATLLNMDADEWDKELIFGTVPKREALTLDGLKEIWEKMKSYWKEGISLPEFLNLVLREIVGKLPVSGPTDYKGVMKILNAAKEENHDHELKDSLKAEQAGIMTYARAKELGLEKVWTPVREAEKGFFLVKNGVDAAIHRAIQYAKYADMIWMETKTADLDDAEKFIEGVRNYRDEHGNQPFKDKLFAYNLSPSFNWRKNFKDKYPRMEGESEADWNKRIDDRIRSFCPSLGKLGFVFQFVTLSHFHADSDGMEKLSNAFQKDGMLAYANFQDAESAYNKKHQDRAGAPKADFIQDVIGEGESATKALVGSTEAAQFDSSHSGDTLGTHATRLVGQSI